MKNNLSKNPVMATRRGIATPPAHNSQHDNNHLKEELKAKLRKLFQFEDQDLDFGIYRIMNYKRREIEKFIEIEMEKKYYFTFQKRPSEFSLYIC
jgi:hypothetical protein